MSGRFDPASGSVPSVGVSWYAKGCLFDGASIVGVGERGPEAVVPLSSRRMLPFARAVADGIGDGAGRVENNYYLDAGGLSAAGRSEVESLLMQVLSVMLREGMM